MRRLTQPCGARKLLSGEPLKTPARVSDLLTAWGNGDRDALARLLPLVYEELQQVARRYLRAERPNHTLEPAALVHEAYEKLVGQDHMQWQNRAQFFAVAAQTMRRVLVDHARKRGAARRDGAVVRVTLEESAAVGDRRDVDVLSLDEALTSLTQVDATQGRIVELRYFGGLSIEETARALGSSPATVKREWTVARAWLFRQMTRT